MKFVDEFRDPAAVRSLVARIHAATTQDWTIMEVCGGQTHAIVRFGLDALLPDAIRLIHGPGCPVCVTPGEAIDAAISLAEEGKVITTFGDMVRVPGAQGDLLSARARGGDVRIVYSPLDAVEVARTSPELDVVFFAVGFETTAPANAMAVVEAERLGLENFTMLVSHVLVPPAMRAILGSSESHIDAFLAAGHVCTIVGVAEYEAMAEEFRVPIVVTGFEPVDVLRGVLGCIEMLESGVFECENQYARVVRTVGNRQAQQIVDRVFEVSTRNWRGIGEIAESGLVLRDSYARFDAMRQFNVPARVAVESPCQAGRVLTGAIRPAECPEFGRGCTPETPLGAPMVSSEGACSAYFRYRGVQP